MYAIKITSGFEKNIRRVGKYETKAEAIAEARWMKATGTGVKPGEYAVAVPWRMA